MIRYNSDGLFPAIVQDVKTKQVLMLAYMNEQSYQKSLATKQTWFYSRSRQQLWHKGATSGNIQHIKRFYFDCDTDTALIYVEQVGGTACHTGAVSCFFQEIDLGGRNNG
ncbi:MAG: phosphoribosyl-AMP cyclohydrolase [Culicoidibacterales bacterium]